MRSSSLGACLVSLSLLAGCVSKPAAPVASTAPLEIPPLPASGPPRLLQPELTRGDTTVAQGTAFLVRIDDTHLFAVTSAHFIDYTGPAVSAVALRRTTDGGLHASARESWGRPGAGGIDQPVMDLGDDLLLLPLSSVADESVQPVALRPGPVAQLHERVWLPNKDPTKRGGHERIEGEVTQASLARVTVRLDRELVLQSQSGSPVMFTSDDKLVGVVSRGAVRDGKTELLLTPALYVEQALSWEQPRFPLANVTGSGPTAGSMTLRFAWPGNMEFQFVQRGLLREGAGGQRELRSYFLHVDPLKQGDLRIGHSLVGPEGQPLDTPSFNPARIVTGAGQFVRVDAVEDVVQAMTAGSNTDAQRAGAAMLTPELVTQVMKAEWFEQVGAWAGQTIELGTVYQRDFTAAFPLGNGTIPAHMYFAATHRTASTPDDTEHTCVALWLATQFDADTLSTVVRDYVLSMAPPDKRAEAARQLDGLVMESSTRATLVSDPRTLLPFAFTREKYVMMPGRPAHFEASQEQIVRQIGRAKTKLR